MNNLYELFEKCMLSTDGTATFCSKMINNVVPNNKFNMIDFNGVSNLSNSSNLNIKTVENEFTELKLVDNYISYTNDDAKLYLVSLLQILKDEDYLDMYKVESNKEHDSWTAIIHSVNDEKKSVIHEIFDELPKSFNSRISAYLS
jgi:hypothetical protein